MSRREYLLQPEVKMVIRILILQRGGGKYLIIINYPTLSIIPPRQYSNHIIYQFQTFRFRERHIDRTNFLFSDRRVQHAERAVVTPSTHSGNSTPANVHLSDIKQRSSRPWLDCCMCILSFNNIRYLPKLVTPAQYIQIR